MTTRERRADWADEVAAETTANAANRSVTRRANEERRELRFFMVEIFYW
jgi:hypothetical protein